MKPSEIIRIYLPIGVEDIEEMNDIRSDKLLEILDDLDARLSALEGDKGNKI